jgi:hypothetical protein
MAITPLASGIQTFLQAQQRVADSASRIASASISEAGPQSLVEPLIDLRVAEQQAQAGAKIIEVEQNMIGSLLDITV